MMRLDLLKVVTTHTHTTSFVLYMPHSVHIYCTPFVCIGKPAEPVFLSVQEIVEVLEKQVCDTSEETLELIAHELVRYHISTPVPVLCYTGHHGNSNAIISFTGKQFVMVLFCGRSLIYMLMEHSGTQSV